MSKKIDRLEKKLDRYEWIAYGEELETNLWKIDDELRPGKPVDDYPYGLTVEAASTVVDTIKGYYGKEGRKELFGRVSNETEWGGKRSKLAVTALTGLKNTAIVAISAFHIVGLSVATLFIGALATPFGLPEIAGLSVISAVRSAHNRRIKKAEKKMEKIERKICEEVQKEAKNESIEDSKVEVTKSVVSTQSKKDAKEETEIR